MTRKFETTKTTLKDYLDATKQAIRNQEEKHPELAQEVKTFSGDAFDFSVNLLLDKGVRYLVKKLLFKISLVFLLIITSIGDLAYLIYHYWPAILQLLS